MNKRLRSCDAALGVTDASKHRGSLAKRHCVTPRKTCCSCRSQTVLTAAPYWKELKVHYRGNNSPAPVHTNLPKPTVLPSELLPGLPTEFRTPLLSLLSEYTTYCKHIALVSRFLLIFLPQKMPAGKIIYVRTQEYTNILVYKSQQDAQVTEFILSDNCSTCFGRHYHKSSGAKNNSNYSIW
jgi:hypothetical protein